MVNPTQYTAAFENRALLAEHVLFWQKIGLVGHNMAPNTKQKQGKQREIEKGAACGVTKRQCGVVLEERALLTEYRGFFGQKVTPNATKTQAKKSRTYRCLW